MTVLVSDHTIAEGLAQGLYDVDFSGATPVPVPAQTNLAATVAGANLGTATVATIDLMATMMNAQGTRLIAIAQAFQDTDASLTLGGS
jgi:hypothetical protein